MSSLPALFHGVVDRIGLAGIAGLLGLVAAVAVFMLSGKPAAEQRTRLQAQLQRVAMAPAAGVPARDETAAAQLQRFHAGFPAVTAAAESIGRLQAAARRAGIALPSGEYRLEQRPGERLQRYSITLPVQGSYAQIRAFIDAALGDVPHASIDDIELRRESAASTQIDARVRLTLYLRSAP